MLTTKKSSAQSFYMLNIEKVTELFIKETDGYSRFDDENLSQLSNLYPAFKL